MRFKVLSLLDITKTGAHKNKVQDNDKSVAQFANYMTFENFLQLRTNINIVTPPKLEKMDISNLMFGDNYRGEHNVWTAVFEPEFPDAVNIESLKEDFDLIPMLTGLDESIKINTGVIRTNDEDYTNMLFIKQLDNE